MIRAFANKQSAEGKALHTDGNALHGNYTGGNGIASWKEGKVHAGEGRPHGLFDQSVLRHLKKHVNPVDMHEVLTLDGQPLAELTTSGSVGGFSITSVLGSVSSIPAPTGNIIKVCPKCGEPLSGGKGVCPECIGVGESLIEVIENPNSSGQGHDPDHANHPFHDVLTKHGYKYSHSTPVTLLGGQKVTHHTYSNAKETHKVSLMPCKSGDGMEWNAGKPGSGHRYGGKFPEDLDSYLKRRKHKNESLLEAEGGLTKSEYNKANAELHELGKTYYKALGDGIDAVKQVFTKYGLSHEALHGIYTGRDGRVQEYAGKNTWLHMTYHKMEPSGSWEIVAYIDKGGPATSSRPFKQYPSVRLTNESGGKLPGTDVNVAFARMPDRERDRHIAADKATDDEKLYFA